MTRDGEITVLSEHLAAIDRLDARMARLRDRIGKLMPMTSDRLRSLSEGDDIDVLAYLKSYEQFEDMLGRTLKTIAMLMQFGRAERMTPRDVALRAVSLGILNDGQAWADAVRVRNTLAHEYPLEPDKQANQLNAAWENSATLFETARAVRDFVVRERLLEGDL